MLDRLKTYLTLPTEHSPVWLEGGKSIAYIRKDESGSHIWALDMASGSKTKLTSGDTRAWSITSRPESDELFYAFDENGHECEQFYRLKASDKSLCQLTHKPHVRHLWGGVTRDGRTIAYASNERASQTFDIWTLDLVDDKARLIAQHNDNYNWPTQDALSPDGRYLLYNKLRGESDNAMWLTDLMTGESTRVPPDEIISAETTPAWQHDSSGFYYLSERDSEFTYVCHYNLKTKTAAVVKQFEWDAVNLALSYDGRYLAVLINADGYSKLTILDMSGTEPVQLETVEPPAGVISSYEAMQWAPHDHRLLFSLSSGARPLGIWLLNLDDNTLCQLSEDAVAAPLAATLVEPVLHRYTSFDGLSVPYWLYVPTSCEAVDLPVVIDIHGGPEGQEMPDFDAFTQYLLAEGLAVVKPNVRGSTGYGKTYTHLDDVEKRLDSVKDIDALVHHLLNSRLARKDRIAVMGVSYGGFMTLSSAARYPDLWACAISVVGMYNLVTFLENTADYRRGHRESEYGSLAKHRDILFDVSPVAKIDDIIAPIMIVQGKNDPRVPVTEAEQAVAALRARGREVSYLCYEDEGHGLAKLKNKLDAYPQMAAFLKQHLLN